MERLRIALALPGRELALVILVALAIAAGIALFAARAPSDAAQATAPPATAGPAVRVTPVALQPEPEHEPIPVEYIER